MAPSYPYPTSNSDLINKLDLVEHFEGGFFKQTEVLAPDAATGNSAATQIYYLLSPKSARGGMHMN
ncbi:hypothetical protein D9619_012342 [Psilocybe cf. subviscida]|nr:hypothetical protein D9619_012342 [Psilocybe cf. subviscida]